MGRVLPVLWKLGVILCYPFISSSQSMYNVVGSADDILYTKDELAEYDGGSDSPGLYLGILGRVYDVSAGKKHYGENGGYSFFRGTVLALLECLQWVSYLLQTFTADNSIIKHFHVDLKHSKLKCSCVLSSVLN